MLSYSKNGLLSTVHSITTGQAQNSSLRQNSSQTTSYTSTTPTVLYSVLNVKQPLQQLNFIFLGIECTEYSLLIQVCMELT